LKLWLDLEEEKKFETTVRFGTIPVQNIVEPMGRFGSGKNV